MLFSEHALIIGDSGLKKARKSTLVIIPFYREYKSLEIHIRHLSHQSCKNFDALVVLNALSDEAKTAMAVKKGKPNFRVILAKRIEDTGSAGGFFTGQLFAIEKHYKSMILADTDCLPIHKDVILQLLESESAGYACASSMVARNGKPSMEPGKIPMYCLISRRVALRRGLYYAPIYLGGDDLEYSERMRCEPVQIRAYCQHRCFCEKCKNKGFCPHPTADHIRALRKTWAYRLHALMVSKDPAYFLASYKHFIMMSSIAFFFMEGGSEIFLNMVITCLSVKPSKKSLNSMLLTSNSVETKRFMVVDEPKHWNSFRLKKRIAEVFLLIRRDITLRKVYSESYLYFAAMFARSLSYCPEKKPVLISRNDNRILHFLKIAVFPFFILVYFFVFGMIFIPVKIIRQPKTEGYGVTN